MSDKVAVNDMDPAACEGCPHRVEAGESTGRTVIDAAAKAETAVVEKATDEKQYKCGLCGCPLMNLSLFNRVPDLCPRVGDHGGDK